jgi:tetratricopeptide (TPR) repeat protein
VPTLEAAFEFASQGDWRRVVPAARQALAGDPEDATAHALLALGLAHLEQGDEAVEAGRRAVALGPDLAFAHYAHGWALLEASDVAGAERAAREALRLDPDADEHALLAQVHIRQRRWRDALDIAERGLSVDPEHAPSANFRALALANLGRADEAVAGVHEVLALDPDDAYAHANRGWLMLRQSRPKDALESFKAALRLDPTMDWARYGVIEAMKAHNSAYRLILRYSLWMSSLTPRAQWMVLLGLFFGARIARAVLRENPSWWPVLGPLIGAYLLFALGSWIADPLSNLFLRLHPDGRLALNRSETMASNIVGACLATALVSGVLFFITQAPPLGILAIDGAVMLIPIGGAVSVMQTK